MEATGIIVLMECYLSFKTQKAQMKIMFEVIYSTICKGHKTKPEQANGDYWNNSINGMLLPVI